MGYLNKLKSIQLKNPIAILIFLSYLLLRFYGLGRLVVHNDAFFFINNSYIFYQNILNREPNFFLTVQPGILTVYSNIVGYLTTRVLLRVGLPNSLDYSSIYTQFVIQKFFIVIFGLGFVFYLWKKLKNINYNFSLLFILVLTIEPIFILNSRFIQTEYLQSLVISISLLYLTFYLYSGRSLFLIFSGFFTALSFIQKSPSLVVVPFIMFVLLVPFISSLTRSNIKLYFKSCFVYLLSFGIFTFILFPSYWFEPLLTIQRMTLDVFLKGVKGVEVDLAGEVTPHNNSNFLYLSYFMVKYTLFYIVGVFLGLYAVVKTKKRDKLFTFVLISALFSIYYLSFLLISEKKIPRYLVVVTINLIPLVAYGYNYFTEKFKFKYLVYIVILLFGLANFLFYYPNLGVYKNSAARVIGYKLSNDPYKEFIEGSTGMYTVSKYISEKYGTSDYLLVTPRNKSLELYYNGDTSDVSKSVLDNDKVIVILQEGDIFTEVAEEAGYSKADKIFISSDLIYNLYTR